MNRPTFKDTSVAVAWTGLLVMTGNGIGQSAYGIYSIGMKALFDRAPDICVIGQKLAIDVLAFLLSAIGFALTLIALYRLRGKLLRPVVRYNQRDREACRVVIMALSKEEPQDLKPKRKMALTLGLRPFDEPVPDALLPEEKAYLDDPSALLQVAENGAEWRALGKDGKFLRWQQNFRALRPHLAAQTLETIYLICSSTVLENKNEEAFVRLARALIRCQKGSYRFAPPCIKPVLFDGGVNDLAAWVDLLKGIVDDLIDHPGGGGKRLEPSDICIDGSSATAAFSAAAALVCVKRELELSLVDTNTGHVQRFGIDLDIGDLFPAS